MCLEISIMDDIWTVLSAFLPGAQCYQGLLLDLSFRFLALELQLMLDYCKAFVLVCECLWIIIKVAASRRKRRAVKMMATVVLLFGACWAPFHLVSLLLDYGNSHIHIHSQRDLLSYLRFSESMSEVSHHGV